jgi:hypothetical protein
MSIVQLGRILIVAFLATLIVSIASADVSVRLSNQQLVEESSAIVIGRAIGSASRWIERTLVTAVTVEIAETLKGDVAGELEVLLPGGVDASRRIKVGMTYPGAPRMQIEEDVFLFLTYDEDLAGYIVSGYAQGKFSVVVQQGTRMVSRDLRGSQLVEGPGISRGTMTLTPLAHFKDEIAGYVSR